MQIVPTILTFIAIISYVTFATLQSQIVSSFETRHFLAQYTAQKKLWNERADKVFASKKQTTHAGPPRQPSVKPYFPRRDKTILQPVSLLPLLEPAVPQQLKESITQYFVKMYSGLTLEGKPVSEKELRRLLGLFCERAKECAHENKAISWKAILKETRIEKKMADGTHRYRLDTPHGYPPIESSFTFAPSQQPIPFQGLPEWSLPIFFGEKFAGKIVHREDEKSKKAHKPQLLTQDELSALGSHPLFLHLRFTGMSKQELVASDDEFLVELREKE